MFNCDIMFKVKAKMRHKIKRLPLLSLFLALASPAIAGEATSVLLSDPSFNDCEISAWTVIPVLDLGTPERLVVSIDCLNTVTNEFEVWFCTDEEASWEFRDLVVSLDEGNLLVSGRDVKNQLPGGTILPFGRCVLGMEFRNRLCQQGSLLVKSAINGMRIPVLAMGIEMARPRQWRSVRVVSRGVWSTSTITTKFRKGEVGLSVKLR